MFKNITAPTELFNQSSSPSVTLLPPGGLLLPDFILAKEISNKFDTGRVNVSLGKYSGGRSDSDPLKDKSFGKITFMVRSEFEDSTWNKIVDFVKSKGFEVTQDANYYDIEPGEREWFPSINFNFNQSNL